MIAREDCTRGHFGYWPISEVPSIRVMRAGMPKEFQEGGLVICSCSGFFPGFSFSNELLEKSFENESCVELV
ncbi:hypothetical protein [Leptospira interrogans]|nr:hypothetical protein [Leptospira interrogans]